LSLITTVKKEDGSIHVTGISLDGIVMAKTIETLFRKGEDIETIAERAGMKVVDIQVLYTIARQFGYIE